MASKPSHNFEVTFDEPGSEEAARHFVHENFQGFRLTPHVPDEQCTAIPRNEEPVKSRDSGQTYSGAEKLFPSGSTYSSFGHEGTTASVDAFGRLTQITRFLGYGHSGFFCADANRQMAQPYYVQRRTMALVEREKSMKGLGLQIASSQIESLHNINLSFIHDRWPRFTWRTEDFSVRVQYFTRNHTIIQNYVIERTPLRKAQESDGLQKVPGEVAAQNSAQRPKNTEVDEITCKNNFVEKQGTSGTKPAERKRPTSSIISGPTSHQRPKLEFHAGMLIRDLDWQDRDYEFNSEDHDSENYSTNLSPHGYSLLVIHKIPRAPKHDDISKKAQLLESKVPVAVALVISPFVNGKATKFKKGSDAGYEVQHENSEEGPLEVTVAYRLQLLYKDNSWRSSLVRASEISMNHALSNLDFQPPALPSTSEYFNFIMRRNVEHILSVCSIPVSAHPIWDFNEYGDKITTEGKTPIALTCGDISGHRIVVSATFFAFQFLLAVGDRLKANPDDWSKLLVERINDTCEGHALWISDCALNLLGEDEQFMGNYWADGTHFGSAGTSRDLAATPFQILKMARFLQLSPQIRKSFYGYSLRWWSALQRDDIREQYAFARSEGWNIPHYHFHDHVWIWNALKAIQKRASRPSAWLALLGPPVRPPERLVELVSRDVTTEARRRILKRFTTQGPAPLGPTIATARTIRESRFLFHARDTALFYQDWSLIAPDSKMPQNWTNTINAQAHHEENDDSTWSNPLRYGLALVMARRQLKINSKDAETMLIDSRTTLLRGCSPNGLFPGYFNQNKQPRVFEDSISANDYWHITFELPYLMWTSDTSLPELEDSQTLRGNNGRNGATLIPKSVPFRNVEEQRILMDKKSIVEYSDEWLYKCPEFLQYNPLIIRNWKENMEALKMAVGEGSVISECLSSIESKNLSSFDGKSIRGFIANMPKSTSDWSDETTSKEAPGRIKRRKQTFRHILDKSLMHEMVRWRTVDEALIKKRLIWLPLASKDTAMLCCSLAPPSEQEGLAAFFDSHALCEKKVLDDTTALTNAWVTEFHLSFYRLYEGDSEKQLSAIPKPQIVDLTENKLKLHRGAIGFRFNGDFFDRYWTCHVIEYNCNDSQELQEGVNHLEEALKEHYETREQERNRRREEFEQDARERKVHAAKRRQRFAERKGHGNEYQTSVNREQGEPRRTDEEGHTGNRDQQISGTQRQDASHRPLGEDEEHRMADLLEKLLSTRRKKQYEKQWKADLIQEKEDEFQRIGDPVQKQEDRIWQTSDEDDSSESRKRIREGDQDTEQKTISSLFSNSSPPSLHQKRVLNMIMGATSKEPWHQRKVLELILFHEMMQEVEICTRQILETIRNSLRRMNNASFNGNEKSLQETSKQEFSPDMLSDVLSEMLSFDQIGSSAYFEHSKRWEELQQVLQVLDNDLEDTFDKIASWESRDRDRGLEKPRWTLKDETKYGSTITKHTRSNNQKLRKLQRLQADIRSLRSALVNRRDYIREELSLHGAEDTRYFTYVTVVFLPLGFATGIFSTSGTPDGITGIGIAVTAVTALFLTILALTFDQRIAAFKHRIRDRVLGRRVQRGSGDQLYGNEAGKDTSEGRTTSMFHVARSTIRDRRRPGTKSGPQSQDALESDLEKGNGK